MIFLSFFSPLTFFFSKELTHPSTLLRCHLAPILHMRGLSPSQPPTVCRSTASLKKRWGASVFLALTSASLALAQTPITVFYDDFSGGSTVNSLSPSDPSLNAASYQIISGQAYPDGTPIIVAPTGGEPGKLRIAADTSAAASGFINVTAQAIFSKYPVKLANHDDYILLTTTFTAETELLTDSSNGNGANATVLYFGLYSSSGGAGNTGTTRDNPDSPLADYVHQPNPPVAGGKTDASSSINNNYPPFWKGYTARFARTGGRHQAWYQSANTNGNAYAGNSTALNPTLNSSMAPLPPGQYTATVRITRETTSSSTTRLIVKQELYSGAVAQGTPIVSWTSNAISSNSQHMGVVYDALAVGFRLIGNGTNGSTQIMAFNSIKVEAVATTIVAPQIITQPAPQNVSLGDPASFSVVATGGGDVGSELSYQWRKNGDDIPGATDATYSIPAALYTDAGDYSVVITNSAGSTTSTIANLFVGEPAPPTIVASPSDTHVVAGNPASFTVQGGGYGLSYQWQKSTDNGDTFTNIPGATSATYTIARAQTSHIGLYRAVVSNSTGSVTSNPAALTLSYSAVGFSANGYAAGTSGGADEAQTVVTTAEAFKTAVESNSAAVVTVLGTINLNGKVSVKSNKTIQGIDGEATIVGNLELASGTSNVVIRGLNITNPAGSGVSITGATGVYIANVTFFDCSAPSLSITNGADNITVAWSEFYFSSSELANRQATLVGNPTGETKPLRVTFHHNWWSNNVQSHMPVTTYGQVHMYNNLFQTIDASALGNTSATTVLDNAQLLSEHNVYTRVTAPFSKGTDTNGLMRSILNTYEFSPSANAGTDTVFSPNYAYQLDGAHTVPDSVTTYAGNSAGAGSIIPDNVSGSVSITASASSVKVGDSFTLNAVTDLADASIQWRRYNFNVTGATASTLTISGASFATAGNFTVAALLPSGETLVSAPITIETTSDSSQVPSSEAPVDGGGSPSLYFLGALSLLACLRRALRS